MTTHLEQDVYQLGGCKFVSYHYGIGHDGKIFRSCNGYRTLAEFRADILSEIVLTIRAINELVINAFSF